MCCGGDESSLVPVLIGGALALVGSFGATWLAERSRAKYASKVRRGELIGERQVDAERQAYTLAKHATSLLEQNRIEDLKALFATAETWWPDNRLYLPELFTNSWLEARNLVDQLAPGRVVPENIGMSLGRASDAIYERTGHNPLTGSSFARRSKKRKV